jgi:MFS transporter, putative metabolite:H+ symporter
MWRRPYLPRSIMMIVFNVLQTVSFYGFLNWVPTLLIHQGITITNSLFYTWIIALGASVGPLIGLVIADRFERKYVLTAVSLASSPAVWLLRKRAMQLRSCSWASA